MSYINELTESEMLDRLCTFFSEQGFDCQKNVLIDGRRRFFTFDLVCTKDNEQVFVEVKRTTRIHRNVIYEIISRMRLPSLRKAKFYLCVPSSYKLLYGSRKLLKNSGIGIIVVGLRTVRVDKEANRIDEQIKLSFWELFYNRLYEPIRTHEGLDIYSFFSNLERPMETRIYQDFAKSFLNLMSTITQRPYQPRISRELLDKIETLDNVGYADLIKDFKTKFERVKTTEEESNLVVQTLKTLWAGKHSKTTGARAFDSFGEFEPILKAIPGYRDHMIHPFQVFLMGALIIDSHFEEFQKIYKRRIKRAKTNSLEFSWLLCSTFHDICYPIQMYERFNKNFFLEFLQSEVSPVLFHTEKLLLDNNHLKYIDQLVALYTHMQGHGERKTTWEYDSSCKIDGFLRSTMVEEVTKKNHAVLSALALLKKMLAEKHVRRRLTSYLRGRFSTDVYPAALAIAIHDHRMLAKLKEPISFENMPLSLLLVYCDAVQECGRSQQEDFELALFDCRGETVESTLVFGNEKDFKNKAEEAEGVFKKISSKTTCLKLNLKYKGSIRSENTCKNG